MIRLVTLAAAVLLPAAVAQAQVATFPSYTVRVVQASPAGSMGETALIFGVAATFGDKPTFFAVERRLNTLKAGNPVESHHWIDGRACPALAGVVAEIGDLPAARLAAPKGPQPAYPPFHVAVTSITGPAAPTPDGTTSVRISDWGGPISLWWTRAGKRLSTCWKDTPPVVADVPVQGFMATPEDAERWAR